MKVIDLLNKIANGEEVPNFIIDEVEYYMGANGYLRECMGDDAQWYIDKSWLNTEARILEEPKGIPEKICTNRIINTKDILEFEMIQNKINAEYTYAINWILDYLESKGDE